MKAAVRVKGEVRIEFGLRRRPTGLLWLLLPLLPSAGRVCLLSNRCVCLHAAVRCVRCVRVCERARVREEWVVVAGFMRETFY